MIKINNEEVSNMDNDATYRKNLESLVTARTEQLRQAVTRNAELFEFLKQLQTMQSLERVHDAVRTMFENLESQAGAAPRKTGQ
jgi:hypothetical protein